MAPVEAGAALHEKRAFNWHRARRFCATKNEKELVSIYIRHNRVVRNPRGSSSQ